MNDAEIRNLRLLARDVLGTSKKRRQISAFFKKRGFLSLGKGRWLGFRNRDVVSGFLIDGPPIDTYIETFVLPAFDRHEFITWALGSRVVHCSLNRDTQQECEQALDLYAADMSKVRSATDLVDYLDARRIAGYYPIFARYLCYLRLLDFDTAVQYLNDIRRNQLAEVKIEQLKEIDSFVTTRDPDGVIRVLDSWGAFSEKIFGSRDEAFSAF